MAKIFYARVDENWRREQKYVFLSEKQSGGNVEWQELQPNERQTWLTEGIQEDFDQFLPMGSKEAKNAEHSKSKAIFKTYSYGVLTARDRWAYSFSREELESQMARLIDRYNSDLNNWERNGQGGDPHDFLLQHNPQIKWTRRLFKAIKSHLSLRIEEKSFRNALYRPFTKQHLYFNKTLNEEIYETPSIFPTPASEKENQIIWLKVGSEWPMFALLANVLPDALPQGGSQSFPYYIYNEDGTNRRENITDWALEQFRQHYHDTTITKWDIFHYVYAVLHHPVYRTRYAANLKRELPRIPFAPDFHAFAQTGARLAELHVNYERQPEYALEKIENPNARLDWRVEKMKLSKDKRRIAYNNFLTLDGVPAEVFEYRLGNRSALEWVIDQYQVTTDKRSGIVNDPNRADDPQYIVRLIGQVITVSLETMKVVRGLPDLGIEEVKQE